MRGLLRNNFYGAFAGAKAFAGIDFIDLVCVNLYPFKETVQKEGVSHAEII